MNELATHPLVRALGWALIHSLWQGVLLAVLALGALHLARHRSSEWRYALALGFLGMLVVTVVGTLVWVSHGGESMPALEAALSVPMGEGQGALGWMPRLRGFITPWMPWLTLAWSLGVLLKLVHMGRSLAWLYGPCLTHLKPPPGEWTQRFASLQRQCRVKGPVRLGISHQVDSLMVLGWLKPVVLIPAAALLALTPEALEALLIHELAHIRRGDFLANLLQSLAESLLFYHPAVWWLSRRIRQEREHCCDDAAAQACGDPLLYASALVDLEALRTQPFPITDLAPAASGGRLMHRIQRLVRPRLSHHTPSPLLAFVPVLLLVTTLGTVTLTASNPAPPTKSSATKSVSHEPRDVEFKQVRVKVQPEAPAYPPEAKAAGIQGTVVVTLIINTEGKVTDAKAISGPPELQDCAVGYARQWEFEPVRVDGKPCQARFKLTMPFRLR